ncbi:MAG: hypothetical protein LCH81_14295 [Bacteroidetes bacterium]|nr:hypothetical protein [Bacteroidota bacterium]
MEQHHSLTDQEFEKQFEACTLAPELFTHEAHLRLAWIHIQKYGELAAINNVCAQLIRYVEFLGARDKYNQTLTVAAVKAVSHFINKSKSANFADFIEEFPRLKYNFRDLINCHYAVDIYNSEAAKEVFIEPDLLPFS